MEPFDERDTISVPVEEAVDAGAVLGARVTALRVHGTDRIVPLDAGVGRFVIGAGAECDLVLGDRYVSARHCALMWRSGRALVRDLGSKNGTFVNGNRVEAADLRAGALITLGATSLLAVGDVRRECRSASEQLHGRHPAFRRAVAMAERAGRARCNVLLLGETGTGKELFARLVHESSARAQQPFVAVNCGAIPAELVASELFGHEKGAFTGAVAERDGVFAQASTGTLFLDEIGELVRGLQPHLLRVLETGQVRRVGGRADRSVDVAVIAATHRAADRLRPDLYHRLATIEIELPPLRDRRGDIALLVRTFLAELAPTYGRREVPRAVLGALVDYPWPGNVRELRQATHRAVALGGEVLSFEDFLPEPARFDRIPIRASDPANVPIRTCDEVLADHIRKALDYYGTYRRAAPALGLSKSALADRAKKYGIAAERARARRGRYGNSDE